MQKGNGSIQIGRLQPMAYSLLLDRGYTSHEHLFEVGLIHMNGRLYDPLLRRFLNADEHIQDPYNTQNYNKYGYVYNNPLMYNDPSGEFVGFIFGAIKIISAIFSAVQIVKSIDALVTGTIDAFQFVKGLFFMAVSKIASVGLGDVFKAGGFWETVGNGALAGAGGGGVQALMNNENFFKGLVKGAVIGGSIAAVSYGLGKLFEGKNTVNHSMEVTSENTLSGGETSTQSAKQSWQENWKNTYLKTNNPKPAYLYKEGTVPRGYSVDPKTGMFIDGDGKSVWAVTKTQYTDNARTNVVKHKLYISKAALSSKEQLNYVMNHEFGHMVLNNNYGDAVNKIIGTGLLDTQAHRAIQVTGSKFLQLNNWSKLNIGGVFKGMLNTLNQPEYGHLKVLENLIIKIK